MNAALTTIFVSLIERALNATVAFIKRHPVLTLSLLVLWIVMPYVLAWFAFLRPAFDAAKKFYDAFDDGVRKVKEWLHIDGTWLETVLDVLMFIFIPFPIWLALSVARRMALFTPGPVINLDKPRFE